jgi:hypothetical protein
MGVNGPLHMKSFRHDALLAALLIGGLSNSIKAETISASLPELTGRYFDAEPQYTEENGLRYLQATQVDWLANFESIEEVRIRISGEMTPSKWRFENPPAEVVDWTELPGFTVWLHKAGNWYSAIVASLPITRDMTASDAVVDFNYELEFRPFFVPNLDVARNYDEVHLQLQSRAWTADLSPKPYWLGFGHLDIEAAELFVEGTLRHSIPETGTLLLAAIGGLFILIPRLRIKMVC